MPHMVSDLDLGSIDYVPTNPVSCFLLIIEQGSFFFLIHNWILTTQTQVSPAFPEPLAFSPLCLHNYNSSSSEELLAGIPICFKI